MTATMIDTVRAWFYALQHTLMSLAVTLAVGWASGYYIAPSVIMWAVWAGREHAQAEYRWIERYGAGHRANMPLLGGFEPRVWDVHSWLWNLLVPGLVIALATFLERQ